MRLTEFWSRMEAALGDGYARYWASAHVLGELGDRTVEEALGAGVPAKDVWRAVWRELDLPAKER
ncbi:DUF3046 domain-containing protein [Nocardioides perillae]|uniref:DUF3046 domain-containing protein n=1 Tax=Nocardioides perillae TaxID=1119534 RepID=A0A7Y9RXY8_9ACTN|nr:hypothetical protein [Nocardioides perillae]